MPKRAGTARITVQPPKGGRIGGRWITSGGEDWSIVTSLINAIQDADAWNAMAREVAESTSVLEASYIGGEETAYTRRIDARDSFIRSAIRMGNQIAQFV